MGGKMSFHIDVEQINVDVLPMLESKVKDLSPLFNQIIAEWAKGNAEKFGLSIGASMSGAVIDPTVSWKALSPAYFKQKSRDFPDQIMVRTGSLRDALTNPNGFFRMVTPEQAIFGSPNDADDVMKMRYNWQDRQVVFLADSDQNMIRQFTQRYFTAPQTQSIKREVAQMDVDFANTVAG